MSEILRSINIKHVRKDHRCNACMWLEPVLSDKSIKLTFSELKSVMMARNNNWKVKKGGPAIYTVGITDGDFGAWYSIPEISAICQKYDIYVD